MDIGIRASSAFTNRAGMRRIRRIIPLPGAVRDYLFTGVADGTVNIPSLVGGGVLVNHGAQILKDSYGTFLRFTASESDYADDTTLGIIAQPFTLVLRARLRTVAASKVLMGSTSTGRSTIGTSSGNLFTGFAGTALAAGNADLALRTFIFGGDGTASVFSKDGVETIGNAGVNSIEGIRLASASNGTQYADVDVYRAAVFPTRLTDVQRASIVDLLSI